MEHVRDWAAALCCACLLGAALSLLSPEGMSKRLQGMVISLMVLCVLLRPLKAVRNFKFNLRNDVFAVEQFENPALESELSDNAQDIYAAYLEDNLKRVLEGAAISYESVSVTMDNSEDGCISIGQVEVIVKNEDVDHSDRIKELLRPYIGRDPVVRSAQ